MKIKENIKIILAFFSIAVMLGVMMYYDFSGFITSMIIAASIVLFIIVPLLIKLNKVNKKLLKIKYQKGEKIIFKEYEGVVLNDEKEFVEIKMKVKKTLIKRF